jgi:hypothetical protein
MEIKKEQNSDLYIYFLQIQNNKQSVSFDSSPGSG